MMNYRRQRIRDPLHGLIEFNDEEFEDTLWRAIQTRPFQRLRRIKQLGFSELVFPGATHTRFAHCIGTFHIGRQLMEVFRRHEGSSFSENKRKIVLAAALLHDIGHGPFSHAFEDVCKKLALATVNHETLSSKIIRDGEIAEVLNILGSGFANDVSDVIGRKGPGNMYEAVVSSQFDADRLDYMQRDRLLSGTQHGAIDFPWLIANIEIGSVERGVDDVKLGQIDTFVLGPKAVSAADSYILGLFQLYETVYFHKATRGAEKLFTELLLRVVTHAQEGDLLSTGLPNTHPIVKFASAPTELDNFLRLDDAAVWSALQMLCEGSDPVIHQLAVRLRDRNLYQCVDLRARVEQEMECINVDCSQKQQACRRACTRVIERAREWREDNFSQCHRLLPDQISRDPYKQFQESREPLNQIWIKNPRTGRLEDIGRHSAVVKAKESLEIWRLYYPKDDAEIKTIADTIIKEEVMNAQSQKDVQ
jgi:HD superfamily phosphohydrolase